MLNLNSAKAMPTAAQYYRQCKEQIRKVLDEIEAGTAGLNDIGEALVLIRQLPQSTEGLNEWTQKLETEKNRLEGRDDELEKQWNDTASVLIQALNLWDCSAAEGSLKQLQDHQYWESRQEASWQKRIDECKKRGPELQSIENDGLRARQELNQGLMLDCVNRAQRLGGGDPGDKTECWPQRNW